MKQHYSYIKSLSIKRFFKLCSITPFSLVNYLSHGRAATECSACRSQKVADSVAGITGWREPPGMDAQSQMSHGRAARACSY